jgi:hypothetical protein
MIQGPGECGKCSNAKEKVKSPTVVQRSPLSYSTAILYYVFFHCFKKHRKHAVSFEGRVI